MNTEQLEDVALSTDERGITIQRVGVKEVHLPVRVRQRAGGFARLLANIDLSVELPHHYRGTHMSRLVELLFSWSRRPIDSREIHRMLAEARARLEARRAEALLRFKYFINKQAPVTGSVSALDYDCRFRGELDDQGFAFTMGADVPVTILCPCSKAVAARGAHNQRAVIRVDLRCRPGDLVWLEELVSMLERQGSAEIYPLLKRTDEAAVTEQAYDHPKFVEDVLRDVVALLRADPRVVWFSAECESFESIHNHSAYAYQEESKL